MCNVHMPIYVYLTTKPIGGVLFSDKQKIQLNSKLFFAVDFIDKISIHIHIVLKSSSKK